MTCYFRHINWIFEDMGIEVTKENKADIDKKIHGLVGIEYKNCSSAWKEVKRRLSENELGFIADLKKLLS